MSAKGQALLDDSPYYYAQDDAALAVLDSLGRELQRVEDLIVDIRDRFAFPHLAQDDEYGSLPFWERLLGLPIAPPDLTVAERQASVLAKFRKRRAGRGIDWEDVMTTIIGTTLWSYQEGPAPYTIILTIPQDPGSYSAARINAYAREITPAHIALSYVTGTGFVIGLSAIGLDPL